MDGECSFVQKVARNSIITLFLKVWLQRVSVLGCSLCLFLTRSVNRFGGTQLTIHKKWQDMQTTSQIHTRTFEGSKVQCHVSICFWCVVCWVVAFAAPVLGDPRGNGAEIHAGWWHATCWPHCFRPRHKARSHGQPPHPIYNSLVILKIHPVNYSCSYLLQSTSL